MTTHDPVSDFRPVPTITTCARTVERYLRLLADTAAGTFEAPPLDVRPVDLFLIHQLVAFCPSPPNVIDLIADATGGASAVALASNPAVACVWAPARERATWRGRFFDVATKAVGQPNGDGLTRALAPLHEPSIDPDTGWPSLAPTVGQAAPVLIFVGPAAGSDLVATIEGALDGFPYAVVAVAGIGRIGDDGALAPLLAFLKEHPGFRVRALRELSPFLADSDLAVVHASSHPYAADMLERIARAFEGNFEFLSLVAAVTAAGGTGDTAGASGNGTARGGGKALATRAQEPDYGQLVERVREAVKEGVRPGASVLVVSKGDDALLEIEGVRASHFPRSEHGDYAGHHPADDDAAVRHLEALRLAGAEYLLLPATSGWWMEHYADLRRHLEATATVVVCRPDTCIVFDLTRRPGEAGGSTPEARRLAPARNAAPVPYPQLVERVRQAVLRDVPADATVLVVSKGDSQLLDLGGRRAWHFPQGPGGVYSGHHPADSAAAVDELLALRNRGAGYLVFPATAFWWLDHYSGLSRHLGERHERVWDDEVCVIYRLRRPSPRLADVVATPLRAARRWLGAARGSGRGDR